jgi:predicted Zn-dependent protease
LAAVPRANGAVPTAEEKELGRKFAVEARRKLPMIDDVEVTNYVSRIGQQIVAGLDDRTFSYQFFVVRDPHVNAFAVPGGYVYVHGGLLTQIGNDDELAGVLGHEIAHVNAHHLARQQEAAQLMNYATLLGVLLSVVQPAIGAGAVAASATAQLQYRREFEQEADYLGARYMQEAGFDPRGMLDFFKKMADAQRAAPSAAPYLLSHPLTDKRLSNLEAVLKTHQWDHGVRRPPSLELERVQLLVRARSGPPQDVVALYRQRVEAQPNDGRARYLLGLAYLETGLFDAAREQLEQARQLGLREVDRELGRVWLRLREPGKARELLKDATEAAPGDPIAYLELGKALQALDENQGAMQAYQRATELAPNLEEAHYALGILSGRAGLEGDGFYHLGKAFELRGDLDKALAQFEKAEALLPAGSARAREVQGEITDLTGYLGKGSR